MAPTPEATEKFAAPPETDQAPPVSAVPQPPATVRANASAANGASAGGVVTVTSCDVWAVAPSSSVTVSVTV